MERRITSLGKTNVSKMKKAFDFKNINKIVENYALAPKAKKYSDVIKNQALELLRDDYNDAVDELNKQQKKRTTFNSLIQQNSQYLNKKVAANENRKSNRRKVLEELLFSAGARKQCCFCQTHCFEWQKIR